MKRKPIVALFAGLLLLASCSNEEPLAPQQTDEPEATLSFDRELSADDAVAIAREAVMRLKYGDAAESRSASSLTPSQVRRYPAVSRSSTTPGTYIVNFAEGGYAVVVADTYDPQVLALNDEGIFDPDTQPGNAYFMTLADDYLSFTFDSINAIPYLPGGDGGETPVNPDPGNYGTWIMHNGHRCERKIKTVNIIREFNLVPTEWHQEDPYNAYCPLIENESTDCVLRASTGCVPIAMAQIMAYYGKPSGYGDRAFDWGSITSSPKIGYSGKDSDDVAFLIYQIGLETKTKYGYTVSKTSTSNIIPVFAKFGYLNINRDSYSTDLVLSEVTSNRPVLVYGSEAGVDVGHAWIVDGALHAKTTTTCTNLDDNSLCSYAESEKLMLHCNWGFEFTPPGLYEAGVFNPDNHNYTVGLGMFYNIKY